MQKPPPASLATGRGAVANHLSQRFDRIERHADGDFLDHDAAEDPVPHNLRQLRTHVAIETPRTIISRNQSPDVPFDRSINAYRGCEHGCVYCFARPTHAYLGLSPGQDFETRLTAKPDAARLLRRELARPNYECRPMALGTNTDPYQPIEAKYRITRGILDVLDEVNHPVTVTTKSARVLDDIDILARMAARGLAAVVLSVTTLSTETARAMEPRASTPKRRIEAIRKLSAAGIPVHVSLSPLIPAINDHEVEDILSAAAEAGATGAYSIVVRLPHEVSPIFREWLQTHHPGRAARVMNHIREMRGGKDNEARFFERYKPKGAYADMLLSRFRKAKKVHGMTGKEINLRTDLFTPAGEQLRLL